MPAARTCKSLRRVTILLLIIAGVRIARFRRLVARLEGGTEELNAIVQQVAAKLELPRAPDLRIGTLTGAPFVWNLGRRQSNRSQNFPTYGSGFRRQP